ncbi:unnamed protein product, partial [Rotaria magnacalcarata]
MHNAFVASLLHSFKNEECCGSDNRSFSNFDGQRLGTIRDDSGDEVLDSACGEIFYFDKIGITQISSSWNEDIVIKINTSNVLSFYLKRMSSC